MVYIFTLTHGNADLIVVVPLLQKENAENKHTGRCKYVWHAQQTNNHINQIGHVQLNITWPHLLLMVMSQLIRNLYNPLLIWASNNITSTVPNGGKTKEYQHSNQ